MVRFRLILVHLPDASSASLTVSSNGTGFPASNVYVKIAIAAQITNATALRIDMDLKPLPDRDGAGENRRVTVSG